jgi:hypothetical protein
MKKITKPAVREESMYYSDFSGKVFGEFHPPVEMKISFGYGSENDGAELTLHLTDEEISPIMELIKSSISEDFKYSIKNKIKVLENDYDASMQMRDWENCDININNIWFLRKLLNIK